MSLTVQDDTGALREDERKALDLFSNYNRGQVVPWVEIERASGVTRQSQRWNVLIKKLKREMLAGPRGIFLMPIPRQGLKLATVSETQGIVSRKLYAAAKRKLNLERQAQDSIPGDDMGEHERAIRLEKLRLVREAIGTVTEIGRESQRIVKPGSADIPRPRPANVA